jgi:hypothetical protein
MPKRIRALHVLRYGRAAQPAIQAVFVREIEDQGK